MRLLCGIVMLLGAAAVQAAEYATVVAVQPHYTKANCIGCILPTLRGYDVWLEYRNRVIADRVDIAPTVGDIWEVRNGALYGKPIHPKKVSERPSRFPSNMSDR